MMISYVLDTDVMVAAFRSSRGASRQLLLSALEQRFELLVSVALFLEYEAGYCLGQNNWPHADCAGATSSGYWMTSPR